MIMNETKSDSLEEILQDFLNGVHENMKVKSYVNFFKQQLSMAWIK